MYLRLFCWALLISFAGSLPAGVLNITVAGLLVNDGMSIAIQFALAAIITEMIIVWLSLALVQRIRFPEQWSKYFNWMIILILLVMAISSIYAAYHLQEFKTTLPGISYHPVLYGLFLSAINPFHLPFWLGWSAVLRSKNILPAKGKRAFNWYVVAIGLGTFLAFCVYGYSGKFLITALAEKQYLINWVIGISLLITAILQLRKQLMGVKKSVA